MILKICSNCNVEKNATEFVQKKVCKSCVNSKSKKYKEKWLANNKNKRKEYERQYYLKNIVKFKIKSKTTRFKESKRIYKKNRRNNDVLFKIRENVSNAIFKALKRGKTNKAGKSILQSLNYSIQDLKNHLEIQFDNNMFWHNYGAYWHIDHIIPQSDLPYVSMNDDNFKICWDLKNLRPLEAMQNILDGARRTRHK